MAGRDACLDGSPVRSPRDALGMPPRLSGKCCTICPGGGLPYDPLGLLQTMEKAGLARTTSKKQTHHTDRWCRKLMQREISWQFSQSFFRTCSKTCAQSRRRPSPFAQGFAEIENKLAQAESPAANESKSKESRPLDPGENQRVTSC